MPSLADAYEREANGASQRRVYVGTGLFAAGALLVVVGILAGSTHLVMGSNPTPGAKYGARDLALTLVGLGIPAVFVGVFSVLPANRFQRVAAGIGSFVALVGVLVLRDAYPSQWFAPGATVPSTVVLVGGLVYALGVITTLWCLFTAVATFKTRNAPGGTVSLTFTRDGETHTVEVARGDLDDARDALSSGAFGGVGVFGGIESEETPDATPSAPTSDGGEETRDVRSPVGDDATMVDEPVTEAGPDKYCGSCSHFDYVRTDEGIRPYCGYDDVVMEDMDACDNYARN